MFAYHKIDQININNKVLFIRTDMNVPFNADGAIADDSKIIAGIKTIKYALQNNAKIILATHLGRPQPQ